MPMCAVYGCQNRKELRLFPKSKALLAEWLERLNRKDYVITNDSRICSRHFHADAYVPDEENKDSKGRLRKKKTLKARAYPTLFLRGKEEDKENNRKRKRVNAIEEIPKKNIKLSNLAEHNYVRGDTILCSQGPPANKRSLADITNTYVNKELQSDEDSDTIRFIPPAELVKPNNVELNDVEPNVVEQNNDGHLETNNVEINIIEQNDVEPDIVEQNNDGHLEPNNVETNSVEPNSVQINIVEQNNDVNLEPNIVESINLELTSGNNGNDVNKGNVMNFASTSSFIDFASKEMPTSNKSVTKNSRKRKFEETIESKSSETPNEMPEGFLGVGSEAEFDGNQIESVKADNARLIQELKKLKEENAVLNAKMKGVRKFLLPDQERRLTLPENSHPPWSDPMIEKAIRACAAMHGKFDYFRKFVSVPWLWPTKRTVQRHLSHVSSEAGECTDFLKLLEMKVPTMKEREKLCIMNIDEMSICPSYVYDSKNQSYVGTITIPLSEKLQQKRVKENGAYEEKKELAYHALSILLVSACGKWKQLVAFQFTGASFLPEAVAKWIRDVLARVFDIGLIVIGITMDNTTTNWTI